MMKKRDYFWSFLPFFYAYIYSQNYRYLWAFSSFFLIFGSLGYGERKGFRSLPRTQELSGGLFSLQMTSTSLHNNTHQPGVCSNRNQVSSWTGCKIFPSAQKAESTGLCCPHKFFPKASCHVMCVTANWGTCTRWDTCCLHWSPHSNSSLLPKTLWQSTTSPDHRISDKTFALLHRLILW